MVRNERRIYGSTGEIGRDGILTPDQSHTLNRLQERASNRSMQYLDEMQEGDPYPMVAMATGIGKGNIIHRDIEHQMRKKPDSKVLLIAGTKLVLVRQTHEALSQYQQVSNDNSFDYIESEEDDEIIDDTSSIESNPLGEEQSFLYRTGKFGQQDANVHIATIQTVQSETRKQSFEPDDYDLVIVDEVHNIGTKLRKETIQQFKKVVGFTATPYRHSGSLKTPDQYGFTVIESLPLPEAQELRLLPPLVGIQIDTKDVIDEIPVTSSGAIDFKTLEQLLKDSPDLRPFIVDRIARIISTEDGRKYKTVVAVNFVWEAQEIAELLREKGITVGVAVNNQAAKEIHTEEIPALDSLERYKLPQDDKRSIQVLISPYVASEGFDAPFTEVLVWASPTDSSVRYTQYTGRLARRAEGKLFGVVVDCLYQTNQYSWSYNMGMWMKGDVRQLENGMLWLGPETDIENLKMLPQIEALRKQADVKGLKELQREEITQLQETDFPLTKEVIGHTFIGKADTLVAIAQEVYAFLRENEPDKLVRRKVGGNRVVRAVNDRDYFIKLMQERNIKVKDIQIPELKESEYPIITSSLNSVFIGSDENLMAVAQTVLESLKEKNPDLVVRRKSGTHYVNAVVDTQLFINAMIETGLRLKSTKPPQIRETDFPVINNELNSVFSGGNRKVKPVAKEILELLRSEGLVAERTTNGNQIVEVVIDRERFMQEMLKRGVRLKSN